MRRMISSNAIRVSVVPVLNIVILIILTTFLVCFDVAKCGFPFEYCSWVANALLDGFGYFSLIAFWSIEMGNESVLFFVSLKYRVWRYIFAFFHASFTILMVSLFVIGLVNNKKETLGPVFFYAKLTEFALMIELAHVVIEVVARSRRLERESRGVANNSILLAWYEHLASAMEAPCFALATTARSISDFVGWLVRTFCCSQCLPRYAEYSMLAIYYVSESVTYSFRIHSLSSNAAGEHFNGYAVLPLLYLQLSINGTLFFVQAVRTLAGMQLV